MQPFPYCSPYSSHAAIPSGACRSLELAGGGTRLWNTIAENPPAMFHPGRRKPWPWEGTARCTGSRFAWFMGSVERCRWMNLDYGKEGYPTYDIATGERFALRWSYVKYSAGAHFREK